MDQRFPGNQQQSPFNQQPRMFIPNQSQTILPNSQHSTVNFDPQQQMDQYNPPHGHISYA